MFLAYIILKGILVRTSLPEFYLGQGLVFHFV